MRRMTEAQDTTPAQRALERTGECVSIACRDRCDAFAYEKYMDGFRMCVCGHTQHAHRLNERTAP